MHTYNCFYLSKVSWSYIKLKQQYIIYNIWYINQFFLEPLRFLLSKLAMLLIAWELVNNKTCLNFSQWQGIIELALLLYTKLFNWQCFYEGMGILWVPTFISDMASNSTSAPFGIYITFVYFETLFKMLSRTYILFITISRAN